PRSGYLHVLPASRVSAGRARARARDQGDGGTHRPARPALPRLPGARRADVPRLPGMHHAAQAGVRLVWAAARVALAGLPALRDAGDTRSPAARGPHDPRARTGAT